MRFSRPIPLWLRGIRKMRISYRANRHFGARPKTLRPGANPTNCRTWEFKWIIVIGENRPPPSLSLRYGVFLPIADMIYGLSEMPAPTFFGPKLWRFQGITDCATMLRAVRNSWFSPINHMSLSTAIIPGTPSTANHFEITAPMAISAVCSPFSFPRNRYYGKARKSSR